MEEIQQVIENVSLRFKFLLMCCIIDADLLAAQTKHKSPVSPQWALQRGSEVIHFIQDKSLNQ